MKVWKKVMVWVLCVGMLTGNLTVSTQAAETISQKTIDTEGELPEEKETTGETEENKSPETEDDESGENEIPETGDQKEPGESEEPQEPEDSGEENPKAPEEVTDEEPEEKEEEQIQELPGEYEEAEETEEIEKTEENPEEQADTGAADLETLAADPAFLEMYQSIFGTDYAEEKTKVIYVAGEAPAESSASKGTRENPYTRLLDAYQAAEQNTILYLEDAYVSAGMAYAGYEEDDSLQGGWLTGNTPVIITGDAGLSLPMYASWSFRANTGLYDVGISLKYAENTNQEIYCNGYTTVIGGAGRNDVPVTRTGSQYYPTLFGGGEDGTTVASTDLTVNSGTYDRIYGAGRFGSVVAGEAKLTIDGKTADDESLCSVRIQSDAGLKTIYMDSQGENIVGGGATDKNGNYGSAGSTRLEISNLHLDGKAAYYIVPNGGAVTDGAASVVLRNSKLTYLRRGYGEIRKKISYEVFDSTISQFQLQQQYSGVGLESGAEVSVRCENSRIDVFWARAASASGGTEGTKGGIIQDFAFRDCTLRDLYLFGNYNSNGAEDRCELDHCTFLRNGYIFGPAQTQKEILCFKNMEQEIVICGTLDEAKKIAQSANPAQIGLKTQISPYMEFVNAKGECRANNYRVRELKLDENSVFSAGNFTADLISGNGTLRLSDGAAALFPAVAEGTRISLDAWGELQDRCKITAQCKGSGDEFVYEKGELHLLTIPGEQVSFWYLSPEELTLDQSKYVYVDQNNTAEEQDGTMGKPFSSLEAAYDSLTPKRNRIVLMTTYILPPNTDFPKAEQMGEETVIFSASDELNDFSDFAKLLVGNTNANNYYNVRIQNPTMFCDIQIGGELPLTNVGRIRIFANGYDLHMAEGSTGGISTNNNRQTSIYGSTTNTAYEKIHIQVEDGTWAGIGNGEGKIGTPLAEGTVNPEVLTDIRISGASYTSLVLSGTTYGSVRLSIEDASYVSTQQNFGGTVYGNTQIEFLGSMPGSTYGDNISGTYYGDFLYDTTKTEKYVYYYSLKVAGTFYQEAEIRIGENCTMNGTGGLDIASLIGNTTALTAYAPINIRVAEGAVVSQVYAAAAGKAKFYEDGCLNLYMSTGTHITTSAQNTGALNYRDEIYENFHLYLEKTEKSLAIGNLYGFETAVLEEGASASVNSKMHVETLELQENAKLLAENAVTVGTEETGNGALRMAGGSDLELLQPIRVYGTAEGVQAEENPGRLTLNNPLYEAGNEEKYSRITGEVTGRIELFTHQQWTSDRAQRLYLNARNSAAQFTYPEEEITLQTEQEGTDWVCRFGNKKDYSVIYLDGTNGDDEKDGLTPQSAVQTLKQAYSLVTNGGVILVSGKTTVDVWPGNARKAVTITSCDYAGKDTEDYRITNEALLVLPQYITLKADTVFACITVEGMINLNAAGFAVTFGVDNKLLPEGITNFENKKLFSVNGADANYQYPTSITIHSGKLSRVDPWTNDQRRATGKEGETVIRVTMTGGSVDTMGVGSYTAPIGFAEYHLTGGKVGKLGSQSITSYASKKYHELYYISEDFTCDSFYASYSSYTTASVKVYVKDLNTPLPLLSYGNQLEHIIAGPVEITVENAVITTMRGGVSNQASSNPGTVSIHLKENARVETLYCGSDGGKENLKNIRIYLEDASASIGQLYANGKSGKLRPEQIELIAANGTTELSVDFLRERIDLLQVGTEASTGCVAIEKASAENIGKLQIRENGMAVAENGSVFGGDYQGADRADTPARLKTDNAASLKFNGEVSGYTELLTDGKDGFQNGFTIRGGSCLAEKPEELFFTEQAAEGNTVVYDADKVTWSLPDITDNDRRTAVYVSMNGDDEAVGARSTPVKTLAKAHLQIAELEESIHKNQGLTEEEKKELLAKLSICILDQVEIGDMDSLLGLSLPEIKIETEDPGAKAGIVFTDDYPVYQVKCDTIFDSIVFYNGCVLEKQPSVYAMGHRVVVNANVEMEPSSESMESISIYGGSDEVTGETNLTVLGGSWKSIFGGGHRGAVTGDIHLTVGDEVQVTHKDGGVYGGGEFLAAAAGKDIYVEVKGGSYSNIYGGGKSAPAEGTVHLAYHYGTTEALYGGGWEATATVGDTEVFVGSDSRQREHAVITKLFRGSGLRAPLAGTANVTVRTNAEILKDAEFCAGGYAGSVSNTVLSIQGGKINTSIYGGGWGEPGTTNYGKIENSTSVTVEAGEIQGNVYAGGNNGLVQGETALAIVSGTVTGNLYGGGNAAGVNRSSVRIAMEEGAAYTGNIFGGSYNISEEEKDIQQVSLVTVSKAELTGNIFAGSDTAGKITGNAEVKVTGDAALTGGIFGGGCQAPMEIVPVVTVEADASVKGDVYGGGQGVLTEEDGFLTSVKNTVRKVGNALLDLFGSHQEFAMNGLVDANVPETRVVVKGTVFGNVYGGGELATTGKEEQDTKAASSVDIENTARIYGNVYGGGKGKAGEKFATVFGSTKVQFLGTAAADEDQGGSIFGGGENAPVEGTANVTISGGSAVDVYGGGNAAEVKKSNLVIRGGNVVTAYAGGNAASVSECAMMTLETPEDQRCVTTIFGGNNQAEMNIQPEIHLVSGRVDTFYGGGNQGDMAVKGGLEYGSDTFGSEAVTIQTVFGGCNNADVKEGVTLKLEKGTYQTVYGGNNAGGEAASATVILKEADETPGNGGSEKLLHIGEVYGGGNQADIQNTCVKAIKGQIPVIYGGGNQATVTRKAVVQLGEAGQTEDVSVEELFGGNNNADMAIQPEIQLLSGSAENVYAGCNRGVMTKEQLEYTFAGNSKVTNLYGGCNEADLKGKLKMILEDLPVENVYGGCNTSGQVESTEVIVRGDGAVNVFGGGRGENTLVANASVWIQNGTVEGNVYGGSGYGTVTNANVTVQEGAAVQGDGANRIQINGSVFGGGYGVESVVENTKVVIDMKLAVSKDASEDADLIVTEALADTTTENPGSDQEETSGETRTTIQWKNKDISCIKGNVYGGGDMGKVGDGMIHQSTNTATISKPGKTNVHISGGYIEGSVFGGGSGTPVDGMGYTIYMGTVFGNCQTEVTGGYIKGSIYGCGHQSRVYADEENGNKQAAGVCVSEEKGKSVVIGTSIFGGGNKGEGANQNASVYTVIGNTNVEIRGLEKNPASTAIYFLSDSKGGVYGDGNLCLVKGERSIDILDFNYGSENPELLKTFYSLQRADEVTLTRTKVVLQGAKDLVDENADDTVYAVNRVGNLKLNESSTVKLTTIVKLLGGLESDQSTGDIFVDRGNNGINGYVTRGGEIPEQQLKDADIEEYQEAYQKYLNGASFKASDRYHSFNVVCVANGDYLELKKSDAEYGNVTGLFTLELLRANPGEGGGFVFANIGDKKEEPDGNTGSTGDFICVTRNDAAGSDYMNIVDTVGGYSGNDYTYYYWYIKGGKYSYNMKLQGYIGTSETDFESGARMPELRENYHYILNRITGSAVSDESNSTNQFAKARLKDIWNDSMNEQDMYAIEVQMVPRGKGEQKARTLGYLYYGTAGAADGSTEGWYIQAEDGQVLKGTQNNATTDQELLKANDVFEVPENMTGLELHFILHKGSGVTVEIRNVPVTLEFDILGENADGSYITGNGGENAHVTVHTNTSITRIVPSQAAYISGGRLYSGVSSDMQTSITGTSSFTAQFITKYVPSAFQSAGHGNIEEILTASYDEIYLLDEETGIGFTITENEGTGQIDFKYATRGNVDDYEIEKKEGSYYVTQKGTDSEETRKLQVVSNKKGTFTFPKGTMITLVAQIDDHTPTYWYYYCTDENKGEIKLSDFSRMNTEEAAGDTYTFEKASGNKVSAVSSNRVTENLTFVFDFSNTVQETGALYTREMQEEMSGNLMLRHHTTIGSYTNVDIMDFVLENSVTEGDGTITTKYTRETPVVSNQFKVSKTATGIEAFTVVTDKQEYYDKDVYQVAIAIKEDKEWMNTQYEEREYAVVLEYVENDGTERRKAFPEGTSFIYQGEMLLAGQNNKSVIIPVKTEGEHLVTIQTELEGFPVGSNQIRATLYSSSVASYYNSIATSEKAVASFEVLQKPDTVLSVTGGDDANENTFLETGEMLKLSISCESADNSPIGVNLYRYEKEGKHYEKCELEEVFENAVHEIMPGVTGYWECKVKDSATPGTYRLEFNCADNTEYWDIMVK